MEEVLIAVVGGLFGGGLTTAFNYWQTSKSQRETWENHRRASYGLLLNRIDEYRRRPDPDKWQEDFKHTKAQVLLCGSDKVVEFLTSGELSEPRNPSDGSPLLSGERYGALIAAMREDVVPRNGKPRGYVDG